MYSLQNNQCTESTQWWSFMHLYALQCICALQNITSLPHLLSSEVLGTYVFVHCKTTSAPKLLSSEGLYTYVHCNVFVQNIISAPHPLSSEVLGTYVHYNVFVHYKIISEGLYNYVHCKT